MIDREFNSIGVIIVISCLIGSFFVIMNPLQDDRIVISESIEKWKIIEVDKDIQLHYIYITDGNGGYTLIPLTTTYYNVKLQNIDTLEIIEIDDYTIYNMPIGTVINKLITKYDDSSISEKWLIN